MLNGELYEGSRGMSGVIGHTTVVPDGIPCGCGNRGLPRNRRQRAGNPPGGPRRHRSGRRNPPTLIDDLSPRVIAELARAGDPVARAIFSDAGAVLGMALANAVCLLNLEAIVVGGGVARAGELLLDPIRQEIHQRTTVFSPERGGVTVVQSTLDGFAGAIGSALGALRLFEAVSREGEFCDG